MTMTSASDSIVYVPVTPAGSPLLALKAQSVEQAWANLLRDAAHMPYKTQKNFEKRGYRVVQVTEVEATVDTLDLTDTELAILIEVILRSVNDIKGVIDMHAKNRDSDFDAARATEMVMRLGVILAKLTHAHQIAMGEDDEDDAEDDAQDEDAGDSVKH
jgi:hypothetical protein